MTFTTCTLLASFILFRGFNTTDAVNTISLLCGFLIIFTGVYLLNLSRDDPEGRNHMLLPGDSPNGSKYDVDGIPTDGMGAALTRRSMQARRSSDTTHRRSLSGSLSLNGYSATGGVGGSGRVRSLSGGAGVDGRRSEERLIHSYDVEAAGADANHFGLGDLAEDSDEDAGSGGSGGKRTSFDRAALPPPTMRRGPHVEFERIKTKGSVDAMR